MNDAGIELIFWIVVAGAICSTCDSAGKSVHLLEKISQDLGRCVPVAKVKP